MFSASSRRTVGWSLSNNLPAFRLIAIQSGVSNSKIPPKLQIPILRCNNIQQQAYDLDVAALQMVHLSRALLHIFVSLAAVIEQKSETNSDEDETMLPVGDNETSGQNFLVLSMYHELMK